MKPLHLSADFFCICRTVPYSANDSEKEASVLSIRIAGRIGNVRSGHFSRSPSKPAAMQLPSIEKEKRRTCE